MRSFFKDMLVAGISVDHGAPSFLFRFCVQLCLDTIGFGSRVGDLGAGVRWTPARVYTPVPVSAGRLPLTDSTRAGKRNMVFHKAYEGLVDSVCCKEGH